jgi:phage protein U
MYCQLGSIQFLPLALVGQDSRRSYEYSEHALVEGKPDLQWTGEGLETHNLTMKFHIKFCNPQKSLSEIQAAAAKHEALPLVLGDGAYKGNFVITEIGETAVWKSGTGQLLAVDITVALKEFTNTDPLKVAQNKRKAAALALKKKGGKSPAVARRGIKNPKKMVAGTPNTPSIRRKEDVSLKKIVRQGA